MDELVIKHNQDSVMFHLNHAFKDNDSQHFERAMELLENLKEFYVTEPTPASLVQDLADLAQATSIIETETGIEVGRSDFQDLIYQKVDQLADILNIEIN